MTDKNISEKQNFWVLLVSKQKGNLKPFYSAEEVYSRRNDDGFWGIVEKNKRGGYQRNVKHIKEGDWCAFYLKSPDKKFVGFAQFGSGMIKLDGPELNKLTHDKLAFATETGVRLRHIHRLAKPVFLDDIKNKIDFRPSQASVLKILEDDFEYLASFVPELSQNFKNDAQAKKFLNSPPSKKKIETFVTLREGQPKFRSEVLANYHHKCAVTDCNVVEILEAAHIVPYAHSGTESNSADNGILMRADIHLLFDKNLIQIEDDYTISVSPKLHHVEEYKKKHGQKINDPENHWPSQEALKKRREIFNNKT